MFNLPPLHSVKRLEAKAIPVVLKSWQIGQILESRAKTSSNSQGELLIQVGEHLLNAKTKTPILAGENLTLQIAKLGTEPLLKILNTPVETDLVTLFLRQAVPQPASIKAVFEQFIQLHNQIQNQITGSQSKDSPALNKLSRQIEHIIQIPIKQTQITSNEIRQFLQQSGFNLENQILKQQIPPLNIKLELIQIKQTIDQLIPVDSKPAARLSPEIITTLISTNKPAELASLLLSSLPVEEKSLIIKSFSNPLTFETKTLPEKLAFIFQAIKNAPAAQTNQIKQWMLILPLLTDLRHLIDQSISTMVNNQLQAIQAEADSAFMIFFNLLVSKNTDWIDLFNINISKEESEDDINKHWSVIIQCDLPDLGLIEAKLILSNKDLHTGITSESKLTLNVIQGNLSLLESALTHAGFNVATLSCKQEKIQPITPNTHAHQPLLDDKA